MGADDGDIAFPRVRVVSGRVLLDVQSKLLDL